MFSKGHLIWIGISIFLIAAGGLFCARMRPPLRSVFTVCFVLGLISEVIKFFYASTIIPMVDPVIEEISGETLLQWVPTGEYTPYLAMEHLPLELCSLFLFFLFLCLTIKDGPWKRGLYAVMFASGTLGGSMGVVMSSIAGDFETTAAFLTSVRAWQFFLFHSMIIVCSLYIAASGESGLRFSDWKKALSGLVMLDIPTFYLNSIFTSVVYEHDRVIRCTMASGLIILLFLLLLRKKKED